MEFIFGILINILWFLSFSGKNDAESLWNFVNKKWKGVKSEKIKVFPLVWSKYLSSWTGLGRSGHVQITTWQVRTWPNRDFLSKFACFGFKIRFFTKFHNDSASFLPEKLKNQIILIKNLNIWLKLENNPKIQKITHKS